MKSYNKVWIIFVLSIFFLSIITFGFKYTDGKSFSHSEKEVNVILNNLVGMSIEEVEKYALENNILLEVDYQYNSVVDKGKVISQDKEAGVILKPNEVLEIVVSKGNVPVSQYQKYGVNELGNVPIMMYHGIVDITSEETEYVGGNVDKDGYNRTVEAFRDDLEFYYNKGYRMIRLIDYVSGNIDVELGKSPIILTFDDGNENNFKVLGEEDGELIIDPNCAIGVLEEFRDKYPDYGITATFFVNWGLFEQDEYNEKILKWLINHGYDIGNHTMNHVDFTKIGMNETIKEVGSLYQKLDKIIPDKYVLIVALPFGSPYKISHENYSYIINGNYNNIKYETIATLRVGWEAEMSCFSKEFNPLFLKRIRAYDNNGKDFDIEMNFKMLENNRYVSDGDSDTIVITKNNIDKVNNELRVDIITY